MLLEWCLNINNNCTWHFHGPWWLLSENWKTLGVHLSFWNGGISHGIECFKQYNLSVCSTTLEVLNSLENEILWPHCNPKSRTESCEGIFNGTKTVWVQRQRGELPGDGTALTLSDTSWWFLCHCCCHNWTHCTVLSSSSPELKQLPLWGSHTELTWIQHTEMSKASKALPFWKHGNLETPWAVNENILSVWNSTSTLRLSRQLQNSK